MDTLILTADDVQHAIRHVGLDAFMDQLIDRLTTAFEDYDPETTEIPIRQGFAYTRPTTGLVEWMPCMERGDAVTLKMVGYHPANGKHHALPTILSTVSSYDTGTGHLQCLMDGTLLTALRTGAASAVASRVMAPPEAHVIGLIGAGAQAVTQLHALMQLFPVQRVVIHDTDPAAEASFSHRIAAFAPDLPIETAPPNAVARTADILCTATSVDLGAGPIFADTDLKPHLHINAVGSDFPGKTEVPLAVLRRSFICPDSRVQAVREGECQQVDDDAVGPELHHLMRDPALQKQDRITVFDSTGWALEDHVAMELIAGHADALDLGTRMPIEMVPEDARSPYQFAAHATTALAS